MLQRNKMKGCIFVYYIFLHSVPKKISHFVGLQPSKVGNSFWDTVYFSCFCYRIFALLDPVFNPVQADGTRNKKIGKLFLNLKVNQMIRFQYF